MKNLVSPYIPRRAVPFARMVYYWMRGISYLGHGVICPVCGGHVRCFVPFERSQNEVCPWCGAHGRHRLLWLHLQNRTNIFHDRLKVLHFAPEAVFQRKLHACPNLDYLTADLYNPAMVKVDITAIPFADDTFDVILCSHVLEHIPDDRTAMRELCRVLKPGGWAILLVPLDRELSETFEDPTIVDPKERERLFGQFDHVRLYGRDYGTRLEQAGFSVQQDAYARTLDPSLIQQYGLPEDMDIFYCTKDCQKVYER